MPLTTSQQNIDTRQTRRRHLPPELILLVIEGLQPTRHNAILPPSHVITKTLLSVRLVSRACNEAAVRIFHRHCMHIDRNDKAIQLASSIADESRCSVRSLFSDLSNVINMYLAPLQNLHCARNSLTLSNSVETHGAPWQVADAQARHAELDHPPDYSDYEGDYLSDLGDSDSDPDPATEANSQLASSPDTAEVESVVGAFDCVETAVAVRDILLEVSPWLLNLVIEIPLRDLRPEQDILRVRPILRNGFKALTNLIEFSSITDELYLALQPYSWQHTPVWASSWPNLRRLQLYNIDVDTETGLWRHMVSLPHLEKVVFARADPGDLYLFDFKGAWLQALQASMGRAYERFRHENYVDDEDNVDGESVDEEFVEEETLAATGARAITIILVNVPHEQPNFEHFNPSWQQSDPQGRIRVLLANVPCGPDELNDGQRLTKTYLRRSSLAGQMWDEAAIGAYDALAGG